MGLKIVEKAKKLGGLFLSTTIFGSAEEEERNIVFTTMTFAVRPAKAKTAKPVIWKGKNGGTKSTSFFSARLGKK